DDATLERFARVPRFDVGTVPYGYAWVFPKTAHLSVGVLTTHRGAINLHGQLEEYLRVIGLAPQSTERHGFVIPVRPRAGALARERMLLVGDAAGFADPVTAEGISFATQSGKLAADAIVASELDPPRARAGYPPARRPARPRAPPPPLRSVRCSPSCGWLARSPDCCTSTPARAAGSFDGWVSGSAAPSPHAFCACARL